MAEEIRHPDGRIEHPSVRHEPSDASFGWIVAILVGALVLGALVHAAVFGFFSAYRDHLAEANRSLYPLAPGPSVDLPREPRLEQIDRLSRAETAKVRARETEKMRRLNSYGPTTADGFIHIPIDRAMQYVVEKSMLKARPQPAGDQQRRSGGLIDAGESNSGRLFKGDSK